jgi:hypothetical protein
MNAVHCSEWSEQETMRWLERIDIHPVIKQNIGRCDGRGLCRLQKLMQRAPDFFFTSISSFTSGGELHMCPTKDVVKFLTELEKIGLY